jgi:hypothetical protein
MELTVFVNDVAFVPSALTRKLRVHETQSVARNMLQRQATCILYLI